VAGLLACVCCAGFLLLSGCQSNDAPVAAQPAGNVQAASASNPISSPISAGPSTSSSTSSPVVSPASGTATAAQSAKRPEFDAQEAFALLTKQCDFGPRPLGSAVHEKTKTFLLSEMEKVADKTIEQKFMYRGMPVTNVIGIFYAAGTTTPAKNPVLLLTHWDSRPIADGPSSSEINKSPAFRYGANGWNRTTPIMAANDGASGTAVLLQLARMFKKQPPPVGVVILLDDGEDYGDFNANNHAGEGVELGSRYFAKHFKDNGSFGFPDYGILLDMVGGKDLVLPTELKSMQYAPGTLKKVFQAGQRLGYNNVFRADLSFQVDDDHIALNQAGMHVIDLVPFFGNSAPQGVSDYTYWHTLQDTVDKCDPATLKIVGETVAEVVYSETPAP
jgi:glutaminyl-peptide cyclotransferase